MTQNDEFERTIGYGESAINYLKGNRTPAYPRNYELWYTYSAGFNKELNQAINAALKEHGRLDAALTDKFYDAYISQLRLGDRVDEVSTRVTDEINEVVTMLTKSGDNVGDYGKHLRAAAAKLGDASTQEQVGLIVNGMVSATAKMEASNADLEKQLRDSRKQIAELQDSLDVIRFESLTDQLTGLANPKHFDQSLNRAIVNAKEADEPLVLLMGDIDHFKSFNGTYGHQTGDQVLRLVSAAFKNNVKGRDTAARYGGEEFAVILPATTLNDGVVVANHIREAIMAKELVKRSTGESLGKITISLGAALYRDGEAVETFIERADACLYASKRAGRNRVTPEDDPIMADDEVA